MSDASKKIKEIEIAIVGAGPAGLAAAIELSKLGHSDLIVFEREDTAGGMPRHCGHQGFGIVEFARPLSGPDYALKLVNDATKAGASIALRHTLTKIEDGVLTFSTPEGLKYFKPRRTLLALGARETPRPARLVSGIRSPNIITTGALQRFVYLKERKPFQKAVIIGSESVSFSAIMTCRHAGIEVAAMIEEESRINMYAPLKPATEKLLGIPIITNTKHITIEGQEKNISGVTIHKGDKEEFIECDGVIFTGLFTPEGALMQESFERFNVRNNSAFVTQNFQTCDPRFFVAGNALRGALAAFKCYKEGGKVAKHIHDSIETDTPPRTVTIKGDDSIAWMVPSMIDIDKPSERLTTLRFRHATKGTLYVYLNGKEMLRQRVDAVPFLNVNVPWIDRDIKESDDIEIVYKEGEVY